MSSPVVFSLTAPQAFALLALADDSDYSPPADSKVWGPLEARGLVERAGASVFLTPLGNAAAGVASLLTRASPAAADARTAPLPLAGESAPSR